MSSKVKAPSSPQVTVSRKLHPTYAAKLEALEAMGYDLERVISIAHNAVWDVGTVLPSTEPPKDSHDHYCRGMHDKTVALVASAEYCRETWEKSYRPEKEPAVLWPEAQERLKTEVTKYMDRLTSSEQERS